MMKRYFIADNCCKFENTYGKRLSIYFYIEHIPCSSKHRAAKWLCQRVLTRIIGKIGKIR